MSKQLYEQIQVTAALLEQFQKRLDKAILNGRWDEATAALGAINQECASSIPTARALRELQHTNQMRKRA